MKYLNGIVTVVFCFSMAGWAEIATLAVAKGKVFQMKGKAKTPLAKGASIEEGVIVHTGAKSLAVISFEDGSKIKLGSHTHTRINRPRSKSGIELLAGSLFAKVRNIAKRDKGGSKGQFKISTKAAVAGVRGTQFFTSYGKKDSSEDVWLCVNEGEVEVAQKGSKQKTLVKEGEGISVTKRSGISAPKPLPWTKKLNWRMNEADGDLENKVSIEEAYSDLLDQDYD